MRYPTHTLYSPALRMKKGELIGISALARDVAEYILPRLIVPPIGERDDELQMQLFAAESFPDVSHALASHWRNRDVLVESTYLFNELGRENTGRWLPIMFEKAWKEGVKAIPLFTIDDFFIGGIEAYKSVVASDNILKFGLVASSGDISDNETINRAVDLIGMLGISPEQCAVIADFHDSDFSQPNIVAPIIDGVLNNLQEAAHWQKIVFQGTNYPEKNPADPDSSHIVPRNEWIAWQQAVKFDPHTANHLIFGDYAADCAKIVFGGGGGRAHRHYRYTTDDSWLVQRGKNEGRDRENMQAVCQNIISSGKYEGRGFSWADEFIYQTANGGRSGNASEWRAVNTTHHITKVVNDVGQMKGILFDRKVSMPTLEQPSLFEAV